MIILFVLVILLILLLPFPKKVERIYYGVNTENGEKVNITLDMNYLRFLVLNDKMFGTITVKTETETFIYGKHLNYSGQSLSVNNAGDYTHDFNGWYYNETMYMKEYTSGTVSNAPVGFESLLVHISSDFDKILVLHNTKGVIETQENGRYIGSVDKNKLEETQDFFSGYYD